MHFRRYCEANLVDFEIFLPESAMNSIFFDELNEPFDLADFEKLVGEISFAIVLFPEAPGSYAETGYFSAIPELAQKCLLVLDHNQQANDSFISLGPAKKIAEKSQFNPNIGLDYRRPQFETIAERIQSRKTHKTKKSLVVGGFSDHSAYEIAAVLHTMVSLCTIATASDIIYLTRAIFGNRFSMPRVRKLLSVLIGAELLVPVGDYGHVSTNMDKPNLSTVRGGFRRDETELRLLLTEIYQKADSEFLGLVEVSRRVD